MSLEHCEYVPSSTASMSLSSNSRAEFCPQSIYLFSQLGHTSGVVQDHVGRAFAIFATGLSGNPGLGFSAGEPVTHHQSLDLSFMIRVHGDHKIEFLVLASLDQQRDHVHDDCRIASIPFELSGPSSDGRVHNSLEITTCEWVSEDNLRESRAVELPVFEYLCTKTVDDRGKRWSAWLDYLAGKYVGVDDDRAACRKLVGHHALPRRDAACQANPHHGQQPIRVRGWTGILPNADLSERSAAAGQLLTQRLQSLVGGKRALRPGWRRRWRGIGGVAR